MIAVEIADYIVLKKIILVLFCIILFCKIVRYMFSLLKEEKEPITILVTGAAGMIFSPIFKFLLMYLVLVYLNKVLSCVVVLLHYLKIVDKYSQCDNNCGCKHSKNLNVVIKIIAINHILKHCILALSCKSYTCVLY